MRLESVCVFCGSATGGDPVFESMAERFGKALAANGIDLVYGGGHVGLMGVVADAVLAAGGQVTGVIPESLQRAEIAHDGLTRLEVVPDMHTRKARMAELADAFVALPGGMGTFEELFEQVTWVQLGIHSKPIVVLDVDGYYDPMFEMVERSVADGFTRPANARVLRRATSPEEALELLRAEQEPMPPKWLPRA